MSPVVPAVLDVAIGVEVAEVLLVVVHAHEQVATGRRGVGGGHVLPGHRRAGAGVDLLQVPLFLAPPRVLDVSAAVKVGEVLLIAIHTDEYLVSSTPNGSRSRRNCPIVDIL